MTSRIVLPVEVELLVAAWDNFKKNQLVGDDYTIDPETGDIVVGHAMPAELSDIVVAIDEKMVNLQRFYLENAEGVAQILAHTKRYDLSDPPAGSPDA